MAENRQAPTHQAIHLGIIGYPLGHTLSPVLHQALLAECGLTGDYIAWETRPEDLALKLETLWQQGVIGLNVTVPHKEAVIPYLSEVSATAKAVGAVNTLIRTATGWRGENTDGVGFWAGLPHSVSSGFEHQDINTLVLGNGGACRGVLSALKRQREQHQGEALPLKTQNWVAIAGRDEGRTHRMIEEMALDPAVFRPCPWNPEYWQTMAPELGWLVQTTPVGMAGHQEGTSPVPASVLANLPKAAFVSDLIYRPGKTALLHLAEQAGLKGQNGLPMLIRQGIAAFQHWTQTTIPDEMPQKLEALLLETLSQ